PSSVLALHFHRFFLWFVSMLVMSKPGFGFIRMACVVLLAIMGILRPALAVDTNAAPDGALLGAQDFLRSYLQVQKQLHDTQLAVERNRQEATYVAASNSPAPEGKTADGAVL